MDHTSQQIKNAACQAIAMGINPRAVFLDVGAMDGPVIPQFRYLCSNQLIKYIGIEPQKEECEKLKKIFPDGIFIDEAVGNEIGVKNLNITLSPACSSILLPNDEILSNYPISTCFEIKSQESVALTTIERLIDSGKIPLPDYIKCDAQGYDFEVLQGCGRYLKDISAIEVECQFKQIYKDQKTFFEIKNFMESFGFILRDIKHQGAFEYEVLELNAFFSKRPSDNLDKLMKIKLWEFASDINSPLSFAQLKKSNNHSPIFSRVTTDMDKTVMFF
jgi:FkbM family methyltransferase